MKYAVIVEIRDVEGEKMEDKFVIFEGDENEIEFLEKCRKQWEITANSNQPDMIKIMQIATVFHEMEHRIAELKGEM